MADGPLLADSQNAKSEDLTPPPYFKNAKNEDLTPAPLAAVTAVARSKKASYTYAEFLGEVGSHGRIARRASVLGVEAWPIWARSREEASLQDLDVSDNWRAVVVELGHRLPRGARLAAASAVLRWLWSQMAAKQGSAPTTLAVIDEAHSICTDASDSVVQTITTGQVSQIAAEGRKYGLHLLLATQNPSALPSLVLAECENLCLMRMTSEVDLRAIASAYKQVPSGILEALPTLGRGDAVIAGSYASAPQLVHFEGAFSVEGGGDPRDDWAAVGQQRDDMLCSGHILDVNTATEEQLLRLKGMSRRSAQAIVAAAAADPFSKLDDVRKLCGEHEFEAAGRFLFAPERAA